MADEPKDDGVWGEYVLPVQTALGLQRMPGGRWGMVIRNDWGPERDGPAETDAQREGRFAQIQTLLAQGVEVHGS